MRSPNDAVVETPLGVLMLRCTIDDVNLPLAADDFAVSPVGAQVLSWRQGGVQADLQLIKLDPVLPSDLHIDRVIGALWRLRADHPCEAVRLECRGVLTGVASPSSGQSLEAIIWDADGVEVTVGTVNGEGMAAALRSADSCPRRWRDRFEVLTPEDVPLVTYLADGLQVDLPGLDSGESGQFHFVIAFGPPSDGTAGWLAVDVKPSMVARAAGRAR